MDSAVLHTLFNFIKDNNFKFNLNTDGVELENKVSIKEIHYTHTELKIKLSNFNTFTINAAVVSTIKFDAFYAPHTSQSHIDSLRDSLSKFKTEKVNIIWLEDSNANTYYQFSLHPYDVGY